MFYQEFLPPPALKPYIHLYGVLEEPTISAKPLTVQIPPIPGAGFAFYYRRKYPILLSSEQTLPHGYILPYFRGSYTIQYRGGFTLIVAILKPGQARKFLKLPYAAIVGQPTSFSDLNLKELDYLQDQVQEASSNHTRINLLNKFFLRKLKHIQTEPDLLDKLLMEWVKNPRIHLEALADRCGVSTRHLRRLFKEHLGISPKSFQKTVRFNRVLAIISRQQFSSLSEIAYLAGYYDHSHFDAEFREFTGKRPTEFLRQHNQLIDAMHWRNRVENHRVIQESQKLGQSELEF
ncbi:MAG: helix-turn-helix transcriptional regulator [Bacteroidota bacterium]